MQSLMKPVACFPHDWFCKYSQTEFVLSESIRAACKYDLSDRTNSLMWMICYVKTCSTYKILSFPNSPKRKSKNFHDNPGGDGLVVGVDRN